MSKTIYVIDLFWKKSNRITATDLHRINPRIHYLKWQLDRGSDPWKGA
jgi:hypothetical protein